MLRDKPPPLSRERLESNWTRSYERSKFVSRNSTTSRARLVSLSLFLPFRLFFSISPKKCGASQSLRASALGPQVGTALRRWEDYGTNYSPVPLGGIAILRLSLPLPDAVKDRERESAREIDREEKKLGADGASLTTVEMFSGRRVCKSLRFPRSVARVGWSATALEGG